MNTNEILSHVDHTLLKATATWEQIKKIAEESIEYGTASICIPQCYLKRLNETYGDKVNLCTVVGFPLGYNSTSSKVEEIKSALADGANEIDMVVNIADVKNKDYKKVEDEIRTLKEACGDHILKVIIETCYLDEEEKIAMCHAVTNAKADYIKTSTGFSTAGATFDDIKLFSENVEKHVKIKAAGGISSIDDAEKFIELGASRLGTSRIVKILKNSDNGGY